jgi:hypothetical protein
MGIMYVKMGKVVALDVGNDPPKIAQELVKSRKSKFAFNIFLFYYCITKLFYSKMHHRHKGFTNFLQTNKKDILFCLVLSTCYGMLLFLHK